MTTMFQIDSKLPKPESTYTSSGVAFYIWQAKDCFNTTWNHPKLKHTALLCRQAYNRYGGRELLDEYDAKAAIYLCQAIYGNTIEWLSIRMVPGHGKPAGGGELELYSYNNTRLDKVLKEKFFKNDKYFWKRIVSSSRMCGIHPYNHETGQASESKKHRFTGQCFALIHQQYIDDYPVDYDFVTAIIRPDFLKKGLAVKNTIPYFVPAYKTLDIPKSQIKSDRAKYAYRHPSYWLNQSDVAKLLGQTGHKNMRALVNDPELRRLADQHIREVPELKLTPTKDWNRRIAKLVSLSGIKKP